MISNAIQRTSSLRSLAGMPDDARARRGSLPVLALSHLQNAPTQLPQMLDLADCTTRPWHGPGSQPAVIVTRGAERWRVKATADAHCSAMEVTLGKLFQLTGLVAPDTGLVAAVEGLPTGTQHVGSRFEADFQDLGDFLVSDAAAALVAAADPSARSAYEALRAGHAQAVSDNAKLPNNAGVEWWALRGEDAQQHAANDQRRFNALDAMNRLLPAPLRCEQLRHFIASRWLCNWDQLNYRLENFGYTLRDGVRVGMSLDFGSCGPLGFRNLQTGAMLPKAASQAVAIAQRPPSLFPIPLAYMANVGHFDAMCSDPGPLQDVSAWPYGFQSESIATLFRPPLVHDPAVADALAEMGYRLERLSVPALIAVIQRHWPGLPGEAGPAWPTAAELAEHLLRRRDALLAWFDPVQIADWVQADPDRAARVRQELTDAAQAMLGAPADRTD
ncbi:TPA: hypothetical protein QDZ10_001092 [Stenotrophomonas maltophilia]|nr:hypothetical protein [Stenotrophomonas maltophilia]